MRAESAIVRSAVLASGIGIGVGPTSAIPSSLATEALSAPQTTVSATPTTTSVAPPSSPPTVTVTAGVCAEVCGYTRSVRTSPEITPNRLHCNGLQLSQGTAPMPPATASCAKSQLSKG